MCSHLDNINTRLNDELPKYQKKPCDNCRSCLHMTASNAGLPNGYYGAYRVHMCLPGGVVSPIVGAVTFCQCNCHNN